MFRFFKSGDKELLVRADGYINATALCKNAGKLFADWYRSSSAKEFLEELSSVMGIPISSLVQASRGVQKGGTPKEQGTWIYPDIAINLAQWLSPKYAVWVAQTIKKVHSGELELRPPATFHFGKRMLTNKDRIEKGYFSVINECYRIYQDFEFKGHIIPDYAPDGTEIRPDISVGILFPKWLEKNSPEEAKLFKFYIHKLPNGKEVEARQYPNIVLGSFKTFLETVWMPERAKPYLGARDPQALEVLPKVLCA